MLFPQRPGTESQQTCRDLLCRTNELLGPIDARHRLTGFLDDTQPCAAGAQLESAAASLLAASLTAEALFVLHRRPADAATFAGTAEWVLPGRSIPDRVTVDYLREVFSELAMSFNLFGARGIDDVSLVNAHLAAVVERLEAIAAVSA